MAATSAMADINESGTMGVTQSVTASSLTTTANGNNIYSVTTASGVHVQGGAIQFDPGAYIEWPDGSTTGSSNGADGLATIESTWTRLATEFSITLPANSGQWKFVTGSSLTLAMNGHRALAGYSCPVNGAGAQISLALVVNGSYIDGETSSLGFTQSGPSASLMANLVHVSENTYRGSTTFALWAQGVGAGTATVRINPSGGAACQFYVTGD